MLKARLSACVIELPGGRHLSFCEYGDPTGVPVFGFHGTPGSRLQLAPTSTAPLPPGYRLIVLDRPGYGYSTFYRERRLTDWPDDVAALADYLGLERFAALGVSGGGPHVLACASALPDRLIGVACVSGVGPLGDPAAANGMLALNRLLSGLAKRAPWLLAALLRIQVGMARRQPERAVAWLMRALPQADRDALMDAESRAGVIADLRQSAPTTYRAAAQDFVLFTRDWGFRLAEIRCRVHFWQGLADRNVPAHHAELMAAATPGAVLHLVPDAGHFMIMKRLPEILATMAR